MTTGAETMIGILVLVTTTFTTATTIDVVHDTSDQQSSPFSITCRPLRPHHIISTRALSASSLLTPLISKSN